MSKVRSSRSLSLVLVLAVGCVTSPEEQVGAEPDSERAQDEPAAVTELTPADPATAEPPPRSLAELQLELANNNAKLQALGVQLPPRNLAGDAAGQPAQERKAEPEPPRGGGGSSPKPDDMRPSPAPTREDKGAGKVEDRRKPKPKKTESTAVGGGFAPPPPEPEPAKSTPLSPSEQPQLDAATRCSQVCSLSDITCELGVQICELAQRHPETDEYEQACVRATEDCDAAQEACDACTQ